MKKILAAAAAALVLSACSSGVTQEQYDQAVAEVSQYSAELEEEKAANEALKKVDEEQAAQMGKMTGGFGGMGGMGF